MKHLLSVARRLAMPLTLAACGMTGLQAQTAKLPVQLGVVSYNIHHGEGTDGKFDYHRLAKQLERWQPDVIALQEVDSMTTRSGKTYALGALAEITRYYETFCPAMDYQGGKIRHRTALAPEAAKGDVIRAARQGGAAPTGGGRI